jgi:tRNA(adenine34) deaminase
MHQARVKRCVYATKDPKAGALGTLYEVHADQRLNHRFAVEGGVCEAEAAELLRSFFKQLRDRQ